MTSSIRQWQRFILLTLWLIILLVFWLYMREQNIGVVALMSSSIAFVSSNTWGPLILLSLFVLRPLLLLPLTVLTLASGFLFGVVWGFFYAFAAMLLSTLMAYGIGFYFGDVNRLSNQPTRLLIRLRERSFETVLLSRFLFLPGDLVNYASGFLKINLGAFILATAIGGLPGLLMVVLAGAAIDGDFAATGIRINGWYVLVSAFLLVTSLGLSYFLRKREALAKDTL